MDIKIQYEDIFDYVVGNTSYDPIERHVDPERYESMITLSTIII